MFEITPAKIDGVRLIRPTVQRDARGFFVKAVQKEFFAKHGIPADFVEQYYSVSRRYVLRGLHFQLPPHDHYKLVTCVEGEVLDVVVDLRRRSRTYGQNQSLDLTDRQADIIFIPSGCAHGFYVRSERAIVLYNVSTVYAPAHDTGIRWDSVGIEWPSKAPILSERDAAFPPLSAFDTPF
jgi:dTDP-4-dehydrorhamnose 3,5-epimerase